MLTTEANTATTSHPPIRELVHPVLYDRLCNRVVDDEGVTREAAELIIDGALGFLKMCAEYPNQNFAPSKPVDIGWHTFILYTKAYAGFCQRVAGRFIHHEPADNPMQPSSGMTISDTTAFMDEHDISYNPVLWTVVAFCDARGGGGNDGKCSRSAPTAQLSCASNEAELQVAGMNTIVHGPTCQQYCGGGHCTKSEAEGEVAQILASGCSHSESGCGKCSGCNNGWCNGH